MRFSIKSTKSKEFETPSYFDEKASQLSVGTMEAFGVLISSRYSKAYEIIEMINLARDLSIAGLSDFVQRLFYDSKSNCMSIEYIHDDINQYYSNQIEAIAKKHISQFITNSGSIEHKDV